MGFKQLKTGSAASQSTPPKTVEVTAEVVTTEPPPQVKVREAVPVQEVPAAPTTAVVSRTAEARGMAMFADGGMGKSVLAVITATEDQRKLAFPILQLSGGNSGGAFAPIKAVPEEIANQLPQGKKPFEAFILGYRTEMVSWPVGYDKKEDDGKPVWSVAIPSDDPAGTELVRKAGKQYQFTPNAQKEKFDFASSQVGHARPALQLLVWLPEVAELIVVQTPSHYESWRKTGEQLARNADPKTGEVLKFPALIRPVSLVKNINGFTVTEHVIDITAMLSEAGAKIAQQFGNWRKTAMQDAELVHTVGEWVNGVDAPLTDELRSTLRKMATL